MLPDALRSKAVVAVNEYDPFTAPVVGHVNVTFYWHGQEQGTYGYNISGKDAAGKVHPKGPYGLTMSGGTFLEDHKDAYVHYVIVSDKNYFAMLTFAKSMAKITVAKPQTFALASHNCVDFVYQMFLLTDLTPDQKDIFHYINVPNEGVGDYAFLSQGYYRKLATVRDTTKTQTSAAR